MIIDIMTINCSLHIDGVLPEDSVKAFMLSYRQSGQVSRYRKYENELNQYFTNKIKSNLRSDSAKGLSDSFRLKVENNRIDFSTTMPNLANAYEYGSDKIAPHRFIEPAVYDIANKMSGKILDEAISIYRSNIRTVSISKRVI